MWESEEFVKFFSSLSYGVFHRPLALIRRFWWCLRPGFLGPLPSQDGDDQHPPPVLA